MAWDGLQGLRVIDVATALAGPYTGCLFADMGADVIKVEKPGAGDIIRFADDYVDGESGYFIGINRGKRSLTADLRKPEGQEVLRRLLVDADVLIENFRPGVMDRWGLGYEAIREINPRLVYCSVSAFGRDAEGYATEGGNDLVASAYAGLMDLTGDIDGPPCKPGAPVADASSALLNAVGVLAALLRRTITGQGEHVQTTLLESAWALMPNYTTSVVTSGTEFRRLGTSHPQIVPYSGFRTLDDRYIIVGAIQQDHWRRCCAALDRQDLLEDPRFEYNWDRAKHRDVLLEIIQDVIATRTADEWLPVFRANDVPVAPILPLKESLARFGAAIPGLLVDVEGGSPPKVTMLRSPIQFATVDSDRPLVGAPALGQHTDEILGELGYSAEEVAALHDRKLV